jgi:hypothetical protein
LHNWRTKVAEALLLINNRVSLLELSILNPSSISKDNSSRSKSLVLTLMQRVMA